MSVWQGLFLQLKSFFMYRLFLIINFILFTSIGFSQRLVTQQEAVNLARTNRINSNPAQLDLLQQQQLLKGSKGFDNPELEYEIDPYDPTVLGVLMPLRLPSVYASRRGLQKERIRLSELMFSLNQYEVNRLVQNTYNEVQYLYARVDLLKQQDSLYQSIKTAAKRNFDAGQINKLEELQATTQADAIRNELLRSQIDLEAEKQIFRFYTGYTDSIISTPIETYIFQTNGDTLINNVQQQILQQQITINQRELSVAKAGLLPELQAGVSFPTISEYQRSVGYQLGLTIPIWRKQNRSQVAAAQTGVELAMAQTELEQQRLNAQFRQAIANYGRELQSLTYYNSTALPQARSIIETSQRLFGGGELNYIESLRNLQTAFEIFTSHLETHRAYNEAVINLAYLNGTL